MLSFLWRPETLFYTLLVIYLPACFGLILVVLFQKGKGVGFAGAFGVGPGSDAVFGPRTGKSLLQRLTHVMAAVFMVLALGMSMISGHMGKGIAPALEPEMTTATGEAAAGSSAGTPTQATNAPLQAPAQAPNLLGNTNPSAPAAATPEAQTPTTPEAAPTVEQPSAAAPEASAPAQEPQAGAAAQPESDGSTDSATE